MQLNGLTQVEAFIAAVMWRCETPDELDDLRIQLGSEYETIFDKLYYLMMQEAVDEIDDVSLAHEYLQKFRL